MKYSDLDPFNHGTTTIIYEAISEEEKSYLLRIIEKGWNIKNAKIEKLATSGKESNNFRIESNKTYLLKNSHVKTPEHQDLVHRCLHYFQENGLRVTTPIPTGNSSFYMDESNIFCLYDFIEGENFDGSHNELVNIATEVAMLHKTMSRIPYGNKIKRINGSIITHNPKLLKESTHKIMDYGEQTEFDSHIKSILNELNDRSEEIVNANISHLPFQVIHYVLHPHNILFDGRTKEVLSILDFDRICYSQRIRDMGFAMHRFARTCGSKTEKKNDIGIDIRSRAKSFLETYVKTNSLTDEEIQKLPFVIEDEALRRVLILLHFHYIANDYSRSGRLSKQVTFLREAQTFSF